MDQDQSLAMFGILAAFVFLLILIANMFRKTTTIRPTVQNLGGIEEDPHYRIPTYVDQHSPRAATGGP